MKIVFDPDKGDWNIRHRGLSFERARDLEFETAIFLNDDRKAYGEQRLIAIGYLGDR
ncbi:MAG: BrnT family toxin [Rhodospirillales bacterium]|nr:BrnT family toxin [Rhodospirillales bacterium]